MQDEPVLEPGEQPFENVMIAVNQVIHRDGRYYAFYHGSGTEAPRQWCTCLAESDDLLRWRRYPGNPLLRDNKSSGILIDDGQGGRLYSMHDTVQLHWPQSPAP